MQYQSVLHLFIVMKNQLSFNKDGKLKILQVSDPQDLKFVRKAMVDMLNVAYDEIRPDLVLFTGDNILGNHLLDRRVGSGHFAEGKEATLQSMSESIGYIMQPLEDRNIPTAMIYGNHDDMNEVTKDEQAEIFRGYKCMMDMNTADDSVDCDTYSIALTDENGKTKFNIFMLDSAWQDKDEKRKCHTEVKKATVEWYKKESQRLREENGGENVPSILFLHVPLPEILQLTEECEKSVDFALPKGENSGKFMRLDGRKAKGYMLEPPSILEESNGLFDAIKAEGNVLAIVNGHDHINNFIGTVDGIKMISTGCASFRCYGDKRTRGVRLFEISEDGAYTTTFYTHEDLCGKNIRTNLKYVNDADEFAYKKWITIGVAGLTGLAAGTSAIIRKIRK